MIFLRLSKVAAAAAADAAVVVVVVVVEVAQAPTALRLKEHVGEPVASHQRQHCHSQQYAYQAPQTSACWERQRRQHIVKGRDRFWSVSDCTVCARTARLLLLTLSLHFYTASCCLTRKPCVLACIHKHKPTHTLTLCSLALTQSYTVKIFRFVWNCIVTKNLHSTGRCPEKK